MNRFCTFLILAAGLICLSASALAVQPYSCRNGFFPSSKIIHYGVISPKYSRVHFRDDAKGCPDANSCIENAYIVTGNAVLVAQREDGWACVSYQSAKRAFTGWVPADAVELLPKATPALKNWLGTWQVMGGDDKITIVPGKSGELSVDGKAVWYGGINQFGNRVVHTGVVGGSARPEGNELVVGDDVCVAHLRLVYGNLVVYDNHSCGGMNVTFDNVYRR